MGLSNLFPGGEQAASAAAPTGDAATPTKRLGNYFESKYPVAGGLADMVFGNSHQPTSLPMSTGTTQDTSMPVIGAQPQQSSGLEALLKLFG